MTIAAVTATFHPTIISKALWSSRGRWKTVSQDDMSEAAADIIMMCPLQYEVLSAMTAVLWHVLLMDASQRSQKFGLLEAFLAAVTTGITFYRAGPQNALM